MDKIIPRWEWRAFGAAFNGTENPFASLEAGPAVETDELYLLSMVSDVNVKVRAGLMDIKILEHTNADGLEQWKPIMKGTFPLSAGDAAGVLKTLGLDASGLKRVDYTLEQFVGELVEPQRKVRPVMVHKTRTRYRIEGCAAEFAEVRVDGKKTGTIAIEFEDPGQVVAAVRKHGLEAFGNVNYLKGLKALVGMTA